MKQYSTGALRQQTIAFWAEFRYPRTEADIARVYAFRELDPDTATDDDVTKAYGGSGWAPVPHCTECGDRSTGVVSFGASDALALCGACIAAAGQVLTPTQPTKPGLLTRLFKGT